MIYSGNNLIGRIYSGAAGEIRTVRAAVSANYANTVHQAERPFTLHRWLVGDGVARMLPISLSEYDLKIKPISPSINGFSVYKDSGFAYQYTITTNGLHYIFFNKTGERKAFTPQGTDAIKATAVKININGTDIADIDTTTIKSIYPFPNNHSGIYWLSKITDNIIPAQLNRNTFADEDTNGIRRHAGECVFVDVAKFEAGLPYIFGNAASSGAFSVSDYLIEGVDFERVAGVVGNGDPVSHKGANINTRCYLSNNDVMQISFADTARDFLAFYTDEYAFMCYKTVDTVIFRQFYRSDPNVFDEWVKSVSNNVTIDFLNNILIFDNETKNIPLALVFNLTISIFRSYHLSEQTIKAFRINNKIDLIPVKLNRNIEPAVTHNGKGGTAGEIGFFDTISGKFYGNDGQGAFSEYIPKTT